MDNPSFEFEIPLPKRPRRIRNRSFKTEHSIMLANLPRGSKNSIRSYLSERSSSTVMAVPHLSKTTKLDNG